MEPAARKSGAGGGKWVNVKGLGTSGNALALLPVRPGVGKGARIEYSLGLQTSDFRQKESAGDGGWKSEVLVLQFLPDFALWPGLKLGVRVSFDNGEERYVAVPRSDSSIGEKDPIRAVAVQDNFIRVDGPIPRGAKKATVTAVDTGVVIDRVGVR